MVLRIRSRRTLHQLWTEITQLTSRRIPKQAAKQSHELGLLQITKINLAYSS